MQLYTTADLHLRPIVNELLVSLCLQVNLGSMMLAKLEKAGERKSDQEESRRAGREARREAVINTHMHE